ncbi:MAG TPA: hypothetical protein VN222_03290, partial [Novosphingobium sp.]|nr:hypothetical protein [Novosphingobium sp.]
MAQTLQLSEAAGQALALVEAGTLFADIGTLGANWRKLAAAVNAAPGITDGPAFVRWLLAHLDDDTTTALFAAANLAPLLASLRAAEARVKTVLPGAERLLAPLSTFVEVETAHTDLPQGWIDGANPGLVSLSPGAIARSLPVGSDLSVSFSASGAIECEAGALWPFKGDGLSGGLLRISARGDLAAGASFALPFAWGKL